MYYVQILQKSINFPVSKSLNTAYFKIKFVNFTGDLPQLISELVS